MAISERDLQALLRAHDGGGRLALAGAIAQDGDVIAASAGRVSAKGRVLRDDDIFRIASVTKPITAVAAMMLVENGILGLDAPVTTLLPELADRRVLAHIDRLLTDTVPARRDITLRDLLTNRFGLGAIVDWPPTSPMQTMMDKHGLAPGFALFDASPDIFMARLGKLPLATQPGEAFLYHTGFDVAGVLIARASGMSLGRFLQERLFGPAGMADTGFFAERRQHSRLTSLFGSRGKGIAIVSAPWAAFDTPPPFESGAAGLVSTVPDLMRFAQLLLAGGTLDGRRYLSTASVDEMMREQLTAEQRLAPNAMAILGPTSGWGLGGSVEDGGGPWGLGKGAYGWSGAYGTSLYVDRDRGLAGVLLTNRLMDSPEAPPVFPAFWQFAYGVAVP